MAESHFTDKEGKLCAKEHVQDHSSGEENSVLNSRPLTLSLRCLKIEKSCPFILSSQRFLEYLGPLATCFHPTSPPFPARHLVVSPDPSNCGAGRQLRAMKALGSMGIPTSGKGAKEQRKRDNMDKDTLSQIGEDQTNK